MITGEDVFVHERAEITRPELCVLGNHVAVDSGFYCTTGLSIGDYVHISPHVAVIGGKDAFFMVEHFCFVSVGSKIVCSSEKFYGEGLIGPIVPEEYHDEVTEDQYVTFKRFSGVGANCVVMPGVTLGEGSVVGACSLVRENTEPWTIYYGSPAKPYKARPKGKMLEYAEKLGYVCPTI